MSSRGRGPSRPADGRRTFALPLEEARAVVLARALDERDRAGALLPLGERARAGAEALEQARGDEARFVALRASRLAGRAGEALLAAEPRLGPALAFRDVGGGLFAPVVVVAFLAGLGIDALGPARHVHLLALPLLGLIGWNLAVFVLLGLARLFPLAPLPLDAHRPRLLGWLERWTRRLLPGAAAGGAGGPATDVAGRFVAEWVRTLGPLAGARLRRTFHAGAAALGAGAVAGMYARGLLFDYQATWESTFLGPGAVDALLGLVLAPAAAILGRAVPPATGLEYPASGDAAPWIHLWATTAALFVVLPRLALAASAALRGRRLRGGLPVELPETLVRRWLAAASGEARRVLLAVAGARLPATAEGALRALLLDLFGAQAAIRAATLEYGDDLSVAEPAPEESRVLVFSLQQTPEAEVHGALLAAARAGLPEGATLLAVVDGGPYRRHLGDAGAARLGERRRAWDRVAGAAGLPLVHLELGQGDADAALSALAAGAWPAGSLEAPRAR